MASLPTASSNPKPEWLMRNWKWLVPAVCAVLFAAIVLFVVALMGWMKHSGVYAGALRRVTMAPAVVAALGRPVQDGLFFTGHIEIGARGGRADFTIPISGPKGSATLYVVAHRSSGKWSYDHLTVELSGGKKSIDLARPEPRDHPAKL